MKTAAELMAKYEFPITVKLNLEEINKNWSGYKEYSKRYYNHEFQIHGLKQVNNELRVIESGFPIEGSCTPATSTIYLDVSEKNTPRKTSLFIEHREKLKDSIYGQEELLTRLNFFHKRILSHHTGAKSNLLITGPTGTGKTFTLDNYFKGTSVKLVKYNASTLTSSGYKGNNIEDIAKQILKAQSKKHSAIVVYLDEIDKLLLKDSAISKDVFSELLAFIEGNSAQINNRQSGEDSNITLNLSRVFFIFSGAFQGKEIHSKQDILSNFPDVVGINEFCGRINSFASTKHFNEEDLINILKLPKGEIQRMFSRLEEEGIIFNDKDAIYKELASKLSYSNSGARVITELANTLEYVIFKKYPQDTFDVDIIKSPEITKIFAHVTIKKDKSSKEESYYKENENLTCLN